MPTARLDTELEAGRERIARVENRSASWVANQAIRAFMEERRAVRELALDGSLEGATAFRLHPSGSVAWGMA